MAELWTADPVSALYAFLRGPAADEVATILGGPAADHVTGVLEPAWPHLMLTTGPAGDLRDLVWDTEHEVQLEVYGSPAGLPGEADLWTITMRLAALIRDLPERPADPGQPLITRVKPSGTMAFQTMPSGHPRWTLGLLVVLHPAHD